MKNTYNEQSIESLKGADRIRKRPAVYLGSNGLEGCEHAFFEILSNSVDEAREGFGKQIIVTTYRDRSIRVEDFGRGVPMGWNEREKNWNWYLIFCELYAGGKYHNNKDNSAYKFSLGYNGVGACSTQCCSVYMTVKSRSNGMERTMEFTKGEPDGELKEAPITKGKKTGTDILWLPDLDVFTDINIPTEFFEDVLHRQSMVNPGITFLLRTEQEDETFTEKTFFYERGIYDYLSSSVGETHITDLVSWSLDARGKDREDLAEYDLHADICFCFSKSMSLQEYYHNSSFLEYGGSPDKAVRSAFVFAIDKMLKSRGFYTKNEARIQFKDVADSLMLIISSFSSDTSYENQTKKAINNEFIYKALDAYLKENLNNFFVENPDAAEAIAKQVLVNKRSRETADKTRSEVKKKLSTAFDAATSVKKFVNCRSKDPNVAELYIVEGDSAMTSCKLGRNAEFQAIMPVRGKTLNCMKSDYGQIFESEIITDLIRVFGCGVELNGKKKHDLGEFDINRLRWSKIILCTDADEDGFQIRTLLLTLFYRLLPTLLEERRVFIAESPLFEITTKDETLFAFDEFEKAEILKKLGNQKYTLQRSKGLGENEPDMMWQTTMNPETRRLVSVTPADAEATLKIFDVLMGDDLDGRKKFIAEKGKDYMKDVDV